MALPSLVVLHGASSSGARHAAFVAEARARGFEVSAPDLPGHGQGVLDGTALKWARSLCGAGVALRGGSLGAWLALHAAARSPVAAIVAIAPTREDLILERAPGWDARVDADSLVAGLDVYEAAAAIRAPVLYVIARDDDRIPLAHVERLHELTPGSDLAVLDSGGHGGPAHDPAVHALTLDWLERTCRGRLARADMPGPGPDMTEGAMPGPGPDVAGEDRRQR